MGEKDNGEGNLDQDEEGEEYTVDEDERLDLGSQDAGSDGGFGAWAEAQGHSDGASKYTVDEEENDDDEDDFTVDEDASDSDPPPTGASSSDDWSVPP